MKQLKVVNHCKLKAYIGERRGEREDMQDAHTIIDDFTSQFPTLPNSMYADIIRCVGAYVIDIAWTYKYM